MAPSVSLEDQVKAVTDVATDPATFDLKKFVRAGAVITPTGEVDCLTDLAAGYTIAYELNPQLDELRREFDGTVAGEPDEADPRMIALNEQIAVLRKRIQDSRITFRLRGVAPKLVTVIERRALRLAAKEGWDEVQTAEWQNTEVLRAAITSVEFHSEGQTVTDPLDHDDCYELWSGLPVDQQNKLFEKMNVLTYGVVLSSATVDAGFPGRAADEGAELRDPAAAADGDPASPASI